MTTSVSKLYNPFRDEKNAKEAEAQDPFGSFSFSIAPSKSGDDDTEEDPTKSDPQHPDFDPFQVAEIERKGSNVSASKSQNNNSNSAPCRALKPKLVVKLSTKEEVTSRVKMALDEFDSTSEITVEGTVYAQVQCSDAKKNAPFALLVPHVPGFDHTFSIRPNEKFAVARNNEATVNVPILVTVPNKML